MNRAFPLIGLTCVLLLGSSPSQAQDAADLAAPEPVPATEPAPAPAAEPAAAPATEPSGPRADSAPQEASPAWTGPKVELAYRIYSLSDSLGGGTVNSASFSGFLPTRMVRAGGGLEAGGRGYEYGRTEGLMSGNVFAGYQHLEDLGRIVPYVVAVGEVGVVFGKRFHTPISRLLRGAGIEIGADVNIVRNLYVGLGLGYMVYTMDDLSYDTFGLRLSIGL